MKVRFRRHRWKGGCLAGENVRFSPLEQATRRAWGIYDSLACRGVQRGNPSGKPGRQRSAKLVWRSRCQTWQDKPRRGGVRWIQKNPSYISCMEGDPKVMKYRVKWLREYTFDCKKNTLVTRVFSSGNQGV